MPRFYETTLSITNLHNLSISTHVNRSRILFLDGCIRVGRSVGRIFNIHSKWHTWFDFVCGCKFDMLSENKDFA